MKCLKLQKSPGDADSMEIKKYCRQMDLRTDLRMDMDRLTDGLTWVGAKDTCVSRKLLVICFKNI